MRYVYALIAVLAAAAVAYVMAVPETAVEDRDPPAHAGEEDRSAEAGNAVRTPPPERRPGPGEAEPSAAAPDIGGIALDELPFEGECGLFLGRAGEDGYVFVNALVATDDDGEPLVEAAMRIDGDVVAMERIRGDGGEVAAEQYPRQIFVDGDDLTVVVEIAADEPPAVRAGEITVMKSGRSTAKFPVEGRIGC